MLDQLVEWIETSLKETSEGNAEEEELSCQNQLLTELLLLGADRTCCAIPVAIGCARLTHGIIVHSKNYQMVTEPHVKDFLEKRRIEVH